jgi:hypothetical protein
MKVFMSWSGKESEAVAMALRDWLPSVIQSIQPYVSSEDIEKGARWGSEISKELEASDFGILCVTPTNAGAPWLNFEAGALSKSIDRSRVVPFLFRVERTQVPQGPLVQFQSVLATKEEVRKLVFALNASSGGQALEEGRLGEIFDVWWPKLEHRLESIEPGEPRSNEISRRSQEELLTEVLELVRAQQQILNDPYALLPPDYIAAVFQGASNEQTVDAMIRLLRMVSSEGVPSEVRQAVRDLADHLAFVDEIDSDANLDKHSRAEQLALARRARAARARRPRNEKVTSSSEDSESMSEPSE